MTKFTITVGVPGCGKSTYAAKHFTNALRLERDMFREALFGSRTAVHRADPDKAKVMSLIVGTSMHRAMSTALVSRAFEQVALTDTGLAWNAVKRFHNLARHHGAEIEVVYFDVPWETILERNRLRPEGHRVPEDVLKRFWRMQHGLPLGDKIYPKWWEDRTLVDRFVVAGEEM